MGVDVPSPANWRISNGNDDDGLSYVLTACRVTS